MQGVSTHILDGKRAVDSIVDDMYLPRRKLCAYLVSDAGEDPHIKECSFFIFHSRMAKRRK